jgi:hypothetical protein
LETQYLEGANAEPVPYEDGFAIYEILRSIDDEKVQFLAMEMSKILN